MKNGSTKRVVVVAPNWLGDAVMSLPLVGRLGSVADVSVSVAAPPYTARVYAGVESVDAIAVSSPRPRVAALSERARWVRVVRPDATVVLPPSFSSGLAPFLSRVPIRVGYATDGRRALLTDAIPTAGARDEHLSRNYLRLGDVALDRLDAGGAKDHARAKVRVYNDERCALDAILAQHGAAASNYIVVVPGAVYGSTKRWPVERYRALVVDLARDYDVIVTGGAAERERYDEIAHGCERVLNLCGRTTLGEFFALLERASVVIANDSGAPHVAASLGVPVVVLFGSTSPTWTSPLGPSVDVVRVPVHCSPCFRRTCPTQLECFTSIEPDAVAERAREALKKGVAYSGG